MASPRQRYIPELLEVHAEDLAFLWEQRREATSSRRHTLRELNEINERIEAHLQGLMIAPPDALLAMLQPQLAAQDRGEVFAAAFTLLRLGQPALTQIVIDEIAQAQGVALDGLCDAFSAVPFDGLFIGELQKLLDRAAPLSAVAAAVVLANHRVLTSQTARLFELLNDQDPRVCELAWRAATVADARDLTSARTRPYQHALNHASARVRHAAWAAAAWTGQAQALPLLRKLADGRDAVALHWLAVLGGLEDVPLIQQVSLALDDAPERCRLLARFGHPSALNALMRWMKEPDATLAFAAGDAFTRITGIEIHGERKNLPPPADADEFDREMAPLVWMPDVDKARAAMKRHGAEWADGSRWCEGRRLDLEPTPDLLTGLDLEARWDVGARAAMAGRPVCPPPPIH